MGGRGSGRPRNADRDLALDLGLPTYTGKPHSCGGTERYLNGACVQCDVEMKARKIERRQRSIANAEARRTQGINDRAARRAALPHVVAWREARAQGFKTFVGREHKLCGTSRRYTNDGACVKCVRDRSIARDHATRVAKPVVAPDTVPSFEGAPPTRYFTGRPCKHGHIAERFISSGACVECIDIRDRAKRSTREYKDKRALAARAKAGKMVCEPIIPRASRPMRPAVRARFQAKFKKPVPVHVDIEALGTAMILTKAKRRTRHTVNAEAYHNRNVRKGQEFMQRRTEAMAVARLLIPDTLKTTKGYRNRVKVALDFVKSLDAQPELSNVPLR